MTLHSGKMIGNKDVVWFGWPIRFVRWPVTLARFGGREFPDFVEDFNFQSPARAATGEFLYRAGRFGGDQTHFPVFLDSEMLQPVADESFAEKRKCDQWV